MFLYNKSSSPIILLTRSKIGDNAIKRGYIALFIDRESVEKHYMLQ
jgi:hypothetical protein